MSSFYRAHFKSIDGDYGNVMMDILLNDRRHVVERVPMFGFWGKLNTRELMPFVFQKDTLDFGDYEDADDPERVAIDPEERFGTIDLLDRIIAVGEQFAVRYYRQDWVLRLERQTDITRL